MTGYHQYKVCIDACLTAAALCNHCASSCLREDPVAMSTCIQLDLECAAICSTTAQLMSLGSERVKDLAKLCAEMCDACAEECNKHMNDHCKECAEACTNCADQCEIIE